MEEDEKWKKKRKKERKSKAVVVVVLDSKGCGDGGGNGAIDWWLWWCCWCWCPSEQESAIQPSIEASVGSQRLCKSISRFSFSALMNVGFAINRSIGEPRREREKEGITNRAGRAKSTKIRQKKRERGKE